MVAAANEGGLKLAEVLKKLQANDAVYPTDVYDGKNWWFYEDHIWKMDKAAFHIHHTIVRTVQRDYAELIETTSDKNMVVPVLERLMGDINKRKFREVLVRDCAITFYDPIFLKSLNTKTHLVACKNGVYDLTAAEFRSGKPSDYLTFSTHRNFVAGMLSPHESISRPYLKILDECAAFIKDVLVEDAVIDMMLAALCMSMHGETMLHKFFLWVGCGSNGKSKLANLFRAALGDYSITIPVTVFTQKRIEYGRACPELQRTKGRRVVFISEPPHNETLNLGIVKEVTGGDAMYTRGLYEDGGEMQYEIINLIKVEVLCTAFRCFVVVCNALLVRLIRIWTTRAFVFCTALNRSTLKTSLWCHVSHHSTLVSLLHTTHLKSCWHGWATNSILRRHVAPSLRIYLKFSFPFA